MENNTDNNKSNIPKYSYDELKDLLPDLVNNHNHEVEDLLPEDIHEDIKEQEEEIKPDDDVINES